MEQCNAVAIAHKRERLRLFVAINGEMRIDWRNASCGIVSLECAEPPNDGRGRLS